MVEKYDKYYGGTADKYRAGVLSFGIGPMRIGRNSEAIRVVFQNKFAHDMLSGGVPLWFRELEDRKARWYFYFGTGNGNTLW